MIAFAFAAAFLAFTAFGLATDRHAERRLDRRLAKADRARLRAGGWALVALAFVLSMAGWGPVFGAIGWVATTLVPDADISPGPVFGAIGWVATILTGAAANFLALNLLPARMVLTRKPPATTASFPSRPEPVAAQRLRSAA